MWLFKLHQINFRQSDVRFQHSRNKIPYPTGDSGILDFISELRDMHINTDGSKEIIFISYGHYYNET